MCTCKIHTLGLISPTIVTQPESIDGVFPNSEVNFTVLANGQPLNYQWYMVVDGIPIILSGATRATLTFGDVTAENEGMYYCIISNREGNVTTNTVSLTLCE